MEAAWRIAGPKAHRDRATRRKCFDAGWDAALAAHPPLDREAQTPLQKLEALAASKGRSMGQVIEDAKAIEARFGQTFAVVVCERCGHAREQPALVLDHGEPTA